MMIPSRPWRATAGTVMLAVLWPAAAFAQLGDPLEEGRPGVTTPRGTLTITSEPTGAVVTLEGRGLELAGRTPWTISRGLQGIYTLRSRMHTYEPRSEVIFVDPARDGRVHLELSPKTGIKALLRSLLAPGWGQHYADRNTAAGIYFGAAVGAATFLAVEAVRYENRVDDLEEAHFAYTQSTVLEEREELWNEVERQRRRADDAASDRDVAWIILGAVWGVNLLDSILFFPDAGPPVVTYGGSDTGLYAVPESDGMTLGLRVGF